MSANLTFWFCSWLNFAGEPESRKGGLKEQLQPASPSDSVSRRSPWELNHWKLGKGSPLTLQSISTQLPSRAMIWCTLVAASGTNPASAALLFPSLPSSEEVPEVREVPEVQEVIREARSRKTEAEARCIFTNGWMVRQSKAADIIPSAGLPSTGPAICWQRQAVWLQTSHWNK